MNVSGTLRNEVCNAITSGCDGELIFGLKDIVHLLDVPTKDPTNRSCATKPAEWGGQRSDSSSSPDSATLPLLAEIL